MVNAMVGAERAGISRDSGYALLGSLDITLQEYWEQKSYHDDFLNDGHMQ